ncbi:hypothetical protein [Helicobacter sp. MIT 14-3879]|uniref:hypothetical protein n=1 Tax=Helicobacter sp. MIT 14-3879 TaxID=2040649 RepID=UPI000E1F39D2|nr:hypothetical protein [Helicobacter sp. MIT 14-3879]RDU65507.1 hypothetical protein CQA44_00495 [Helicobacter sp. MIT 14-3879]
MKYSFTSPLPKSIISHLTKIWIFYILLSVVIIYMYGIYLHIQIDALTTTQQHSEADINAQDSYIDMLNSNIERLRYEINLDSTNNKYNNELKNALLKLFTLIPDQITITYISLEEKKLVIKGITPTRETYSFLLQAPLKSVFTTSRVDFFPLQNGWYNFTSISTLEKN